MATHSSILAWRIPRTEEPGGLQSQRIGHEARIHAWPQAQHCLSLSFPSCVIKTCPQVWLPVQVEGSQAQRLAQAGHADACLLSLAEGKEPWRGCDLK